MIKASRRYGIKLMFFFILLMSIVHNSAFAQQKEEKEVAIAVEDLRQAMVDGDSAKLSNITSDSLTYGHSSGAVQHKAEFIHSFTSGASDFVTIELQEQSIQIFGNTAIVRHLLIADTNDNNKPGNVKLKIILVWQKQKGQWKLLARQAVHA